jgi:hypothetical protein
MQRHFKPTEHRSEGRYFSEVESLRVVLKMKHLREMYRNDLDLALSYRSIFFVQ